jgi:hypothetical protein
MLTTDLRRVEDCSLPGRDAVWFGLLYAFRVYVVLELQGQAIHAVVSESEAEGRLYFYLTTLLAAYLLD